MFPTIIDGETYEVEPIENNNIFVGDIIIYYIENKIICHRVTRIYHTKSGHLFIKTKGDNCKDNDPYAVTLSIVIGKIAQ